MPRSAPPAPRSARAGKQLPAETEQAIVAEYKAGQTMKEIAVRHGIHRVTVSEVLNRTGTEKRPKSMSPAQAKRAAHLYASGLSLAGVGAQLGFNPTTIRVTLQRHGIVMRDFHGHVR